MGVAKMSVLTRVLFALQIAFLLIGLAASLVPVFPMTHSFWGCNRMWTSLNPNQIGINDVLPDSPASAAGLRNRDRILSIDGQPVDGWKMWDQMTERLQPGRQVQLRVKRNDAEQTLTVTGLEPQLEAVVYYDWQLAFAGSCIVFLILLVATQPMRPLLAIWRPILLVLAGLAGAAMLLLYNWRGDTELLNRHWPVDNLPFPWMQFLVCVAVAMGLAGLGTWEIRRTIAQCQRRVQTEATVNDADRAATGFAAEKPRE